MQVPFKKVFARLSIGLPTPATRNHCSYFNSLNSGVQVLAIWVSDLCSVHHRQSEVVVSMRTNCSGNCRRRESETSVREVPTSQTHSNVDMGFIVRGKSLCAKSGSELLLCGTLKPSTPHHQEMHPASDTCTRSPTDGHITKDTRKTPTERRNKPSRTDKTRTRTTFRSPHSAEYPLLISCGGCRRHGASRVFAR